ncbi:MFS transporter [Streptomyces mirabilis]|uniref:MFS transporter n=1 Tax=Streptomyces mirabilis TaxID=68239 RepID=UPI0033A9E395
MSEQRSKTGVAAPPDNAAAAEGPRRPGLALAVIATAQLMVVLDATIVNVALPHVQQALGLSGSGLQWVVNAYSLTFGGLLLLGGRAGDLLGRRKMFIAGLLLFSAASLLGGFATTQEWLLAARAVQGVGAAITAPAALSLITTNFPEGPQRNKAMGVYASMSVAGGAVGLLAGGALTSYVSWRWVLFVNVPIGLAVALAAPRVLAEASRHRGRFDLPGAITGTGGIAALVYGLSSAATTQDGVSHWGDAKVIVSFVAAVVLLVAFVVIETRSLHALLPLRLLRNRNRTGAYLIFAGAGTGIFGMFFFLTLFMQSVWGYSALKSGVSYMPFTVATLVSSATAAQLVPRVGPRPLLLIGSASSTGGLFWLSRISEHSTYAGGLLGPTMLTGVGIGMVFVPASLTALSGVAEADSGVASSLLNTGQQVGGATGLAVLGTIAWTTVADQAQTHAAHPVPGAHDLATGFSRGLLADSGIALLTFVITLATIRLKRADLAGSTQPAPAP